MQLKIAANKGTPGILQAVKNVMFPTFLAIYLASLSDCGMPPASQ
jgi:hypothetical protein